MPIKHILHNFTVFVDGKGKIGRVNEFTPPKLAVKTQEFNAGGMSAPVDVPMGAHEKLEAELTLNGFDPDVLKLFSVVTGQTIPITMRGASLDDDGTTHDMVIKMRGFIQEMDRGNVKVGDEATLKLSLSLNYYKEEQDGHTLIEADPVNMVMMVNGIDQLAATRKALGV